MKTGTYVKIPKEEMCYSDHNEDIRVKGDCDYCGGVEIQLENEN